MMAYIFVTFYLTGVQFYAPPSKKSHKNPNQKWAKCFVKVPIKDFNGPFKDIIVHFSKRYLKTP